MREEVSAKWGGVVTALMRLKECGVVGLESCFV